MTPGQERADDHQYSNIYRGDAGLQTRCVRGCSDIRTRTDTTTDSRVPLITRVTSSSSPSITRFPLARQDPGLVQRQGTFTRDESQAFMVRYQEFVQNDWRVGTNWGIFTLATGLEHRY